MLIKTDSFGNNYVQLDRGFSFEGTDPKQWEKQLSDYINQKIRNGEDLLLVSEDGHFLMLTERSAYELSDRHIPKIKKALDKYLPQDEYALKARIASHIDEVVEVAHFKNWREDVGNKHYNDVGEDGFNYFRAFVKDGDGKQSEYYRVTFSAGLNGNEETVYSIGDMQKRSIPTSNGSSGKTDALNGKDASNTVYTTEQEKSQEKSSTALAFEKYFAKNPNAKVDLSEETESLSTSGDEMHLFASIAEQREVWKLKLTQGTVLCVD